MQRLLLLIILILPLSSNAQSVDDLQWGTAVDGLQMSISRIKDADPKVPSFQVALRNVGEKDIILNLGAMLANGKMQEPDALSFIITDANGRTLRAHFAGVWSVDGRVDDYIVPLRAGSMYTLRLSSRSFALPIDNMFIAPRLLSSGNSTIMAEFDGGGAKATNLDTPGLKLMNFWTGKLQSTVLKVEAR